MTKEGLVGGGEVSVKPKSDMVPIIKGVRVDKLDLINHGCKSCVLRMYHQCPHGLIDDTDVYGPGYCDGLVNFFKGLLDGVENPIKEELWERYQLYLLRLENQDDFKELDRLKKEIAVMREKGIKYSDKEYQHLQFKLNGLKMWWIKLNDVALKGLGKIVDRDKGSKVAVDVTHIGLSQIHKIVKKQREKIVDVEVLEDGNEVVNDG